MGLKPLKKFGQNYLIDKNIVNKMIDSLDLNPNDAVLEIGPGKGFITSELTPKLEKLYAVEIDSRVINDLEDKFNNIIVFEKDFSKFDLTSIDRSKKLKIIGNIPFNQTGNFLFKFIEDIDLVKEAVLIIPLDIAKRITAKKKTKEYGILTILFSYFSTAKIVSKVSRNVFLPRPNLEASIIHLKFDKSLNSEINNKTFIKVVKASFGNRRKTLNNSLRNSIFSKCDFSELELSLKKRAEELDVDEFLKLTKYIQQKYV